MGSNLNQKSVLQKRNTFFIEKKKKQKKEKKQKKKKQKKKKRQSLSQATVLKIKTLKTIYNMPCFPSSIYMNHKSIDFFLLRKNILNLIILISYLFIILSGFDLVLNFLKFFSKYF